MFTKNFYKLVPFSLLSAYSHSNVIKLNGSKEGLVYARVPSAGSVYTPRSYSAVPTIYVYATNRIDSPTHFDKTPDTVVLSYGRIDGAIAYAEGGTTYRAPRQRITFSSEVFSNDIYTETVANTVLTGLTFSYGNNNSSENLIDENNKIQCKRSIIILNRNTYDVTVRSVQYTIGAQFSADLTQWVDDYALIWASNLDEPITIAPNQSAEVVINFTIDCDMFSHVAE